MKDKDKDTSYTAMDDLLPTRRPGPPDPKGRPTGDSYTGADPPDNQGGGGTGSTSTEDPYDPSYERPSNQGGGTA